MSKNMRRMVVGFLAIAIFASGLSFSSVAEAKKHKKPKNNGTALVAQAATSPRVYVSLVFDDGESNTYNTVMPILKNKGITATACIVYNWMGSKDHMTSVQVKNLQNKYGWEICNHTLDHPPLLAISKSEATKQICEAQKSFAKEGFKVKTFAPPFGEYNNYTKTITASCELEFLRNSDVNNQPFNYRNDFNDMNVEAIGIRSNTTAKDIKNYLEKAKKEAIARGEDVWVIFNFHGVNKIPTDMYQCSIANFTAIVNSLYSEKKSGGIILTNMTPTGELFLH